MRGRQCAVGISLLSLACMLVLVMADMRGLFLLVLAIHSHCRPRILQRYQNQKEDNEELFHSRYDNGPSV